MIQINTSQLKKVNQLRPLLLSLIFCILSLPANLIAQDHLKCGVKDSPYKNGGDDPIIIEGSGCPDWESFVPPCFDGSVMNIPLRVFVTRNDKGESDFTLDDLMQSISELNIAFVDADMHFEIDGNINFIHRSDLHQYNTTTDGSGFVQSDSHINLIFTNSVIPADGVPVGGVGGIGGAVVAQYTAASTLIHEIGHAFGLMHTFDGSQEAVDRTRDEDQDGCLDCHQTGDYFCDTPADIKDINPHLTNCIYSSGPTDQYGDLLMPDVTNFMSYAGGCRNQFSPHQLKKCQGRACVQNITCWPAAQFTNVHAEFKVSDLYVYENEIIDFTNLSSSVDNATLISSWTMGDNTEYSQSDVAHSYSVAGEYEVSLVATDNQYSSTFTKTVHVLSNEQTSLEFFEDFEDGTADGLGWSNDNIVTHDIVSSPSGGSTLNFEVIGIGGGGGLQSFLEYSIDLNSSPSSSNHHFIEFDLKFNDAASTPHSEANILVRANGQVLNNGRIYRNRPWDGWMNYAFELPATFSPENVHLEILFYAGNVLESVCLDNLRIYSTQDYAEFSSSDNFGLNPFSVNLMGNGDENSLFASSLGDVFCDDQGNLDLTFEDSDEFDITYRNGDHTVTSNNLIHVKESIAYPFEYTFNEITGASTGLSVRTKNTRLQLDGGHLLKRIYGANSTSEANYEFVLNATGGNEVQMQIDAEIYGNIEVFRNDALIETFTPELEDGKDVAGTRVVNLPEAGSSERIRLRFLTNYNHSVFKKLKVYDLVDCIADPEVSLKGCQQIAIAVAESSSCYNKVVIDFGDGESSIYYPEFYHQYEEPGNYIIDFKYYWDDVLIGAKNSFVNVSAFPTDSKIKIVNVPGNEYAILTYNSPEYDVDPPSVNSIIWSINGISNNVSVSNLFGNQYIFEIGEDPELQYEICATVEYSNYLLSCKDVICKEHNFMQNNPEDCNINNYEPSFTIEQNGLVFTLIPTFLSDSYYNYEWSLESTTSTNIGTNMITYYIADDLSSQLEFCLKVTNKENGGCSQSACEKITPNQELPICFIDENPEGVSLGYKIEANTIYLKANSIPENSSSLEMEVKWGDGTNETFMFYEINDHSQPYPATNDYSIEVLFTDINHPADCSWGTIVHVRDPKLSIWTGGPNQHSPIRPNTEGNSDWSNFTVSIAQAASAQTIEGTDRGNFAILPKSDEEAQVQQNTINIFPNPTAGSIEIYWELDAVKSFEILDIQGRVIKAEQAMMDQSIKVENLPSGLCLIRLISQDSKGEIKHQIQRVLVIN